MMFFGMGRDSSCLSTHLLVQINWLLYVVIVIVNNTIPHEGPTSVFIDPNPGFIEKSSFMLSFVRCLFIARKKTIFTWQTNRRDSLTVSVNTGALWASVEFTVPLRMMGSHLDCCKRKGSTV